MSNPWKQLCGGIAITIAWFLVTSSNYQLHAAEVAVAKEPIVEEPVVEKNAQQDSAKQDDAKKDNAKKKAPPHLVELAAGKLVLPVPGEWKLVKPRNRIIQHEFSVAPVKGDEIASRMTIMSAGGGVKANIARWEGQFKTSDGKPLGDDDKRVTEKKIGDLKIHLVDLSGDFQDSPRGPFGPKVNRPGYRMLAAIIPLKEGGTWFVKLYGPQATIKSAEKSFSAMIAGVKLTK